MGNPHSYDRHGEEFWFIFRFCGGCVVCRSSIEFGKSAVLLVVLAGMLGISPLKAGESWDYPGGLTVTPPTVTTLYIHAFGSSWDEPETLSFEVLPVYTIIRGITVNGDTLEYLYPSYSSSHWYLQDTLLLWSVIDWDEPISDHFDKGTEGRENN